MSGQTENLRLSAFAAKALRSLKELNPGNYHQVWSEELRQKIMTAIDENAHRLFAMYHVKLSECMSETTVREQRVEDLIGDMTIQFANVINDVIYETSKEMTDIYLDSYDLANLLCKETLLFLGYYRETA